MIPLSASELWHSVQRDGSKFSFLKSTTHRFALHRHPEMSLVVVETRLLLLEDFTFFSSFRWSQIKVDVLRTWSPPDNFTFPSAIGNMICFTNFGRYHLFRIESFCVDFWCVHPFQLPTSATEMSPFQIRTAYKVYPTAEIGWHSTIEPNGIIGPLKGSPDRLSQGGFPSDKRSWTFRR